MMIIIDCASSSEPANDGWKLISSKSRYAVSGLVAENNVWYVVHDNKKRNQPRVGWIDVSKGEYHKLDWTGKMIPIDLEALVAVPNKPNQMIAMTSKGACYHITVNREKGTAETLREFIIPGLSKKVELEGLGLLKTAENYLMVWGDRGSDKTDGVLHYGMIDLNTGTIKQQGTHTVFVSWPQKDVRHISDLFVEPDGTCWISSASDPGDYGPFDSAVTRIGRFQTASGLIQFTPDTDEYSIREKGYKIEALNVIDGIGYFCTDDEKDGVSIKMRKL